MYEKIRALDGNFVGYRITGTLSKKEMKTISEDIEKGIAARGKVRLMIVVEPYSDITIGADALYENLKFVMPYTDRIEKLALVSQDASEKTYMAIFGLFSGIEIEHFDRSRYEAALQWIGK